MQRACMAAMCVFGMRATAREEKRRDKKKAKSSCRRRSARKPRKFLMKGTRHSGVHFFLRRLLRAVSISPFSQALSRGQTHLFFFFNSLSAHPERPLCRPHASEKKRKKKNGASVGRRPAAFGCCSNAAVDDAFDVVGVVGTSSSRPCPCSSPPPPRRPSRLGRHVLQGRWRRHRRRERARAPHPEAQPVHRGLLRHGSLR